MKNMNDLEKIRGVCLALPGATEDIKWKKDLVFSVGGKMFAAMNIEPPHDLGFKVTPGEFSELTVQEGISPAPYMAKHDWITFRDHRVMSFLELTRLLRQSYDMTVAKLPKKVQAQLSQHAAKTPQVRSKKRMKGDGGRGKEK